MIEALRGALNIARGFLIGVAEIIPGVSGGTIALIVGVYTSVIHSASAVVTGCVELVSGKGMKTALAAWKEAHWGIVIPVLTGMVAGIVAGAAALEPIIKDFPT